MEGFTPWPKEFADKYRKAGYWLDRTISEVMDETFSKHSSRTALITSNGRSFTYKELGSLVTRLALHMVNLGISKYDRLILQMPNIPEVVITYLAALKAGAIPIMALFAHRETEISFLPSSHRPERLLLHQHGRDLTIKKWRLRCKLIILT